MRIIFKQASVRTWEQCSAYKRMVRAGTVGSQSYYSTAYTQYRHLFLSASQVVRQQITKVETVMLCGTGQSHEEVLLTLEAFREVKRVEAVDWDIGNLEALVQDLQHSPAASRDVDVTVHHNDLRNPETVPKGAADFAFANKLFDLYKYEGQLEGFYIQCLLGGISTCMAPKGILFSFDHPLHPSEENGFYEIALTVGLKKIADRLLMKVR